MEHSNLIELVRTLSQEEKEQIRQFVALPLFNNGKMKAYVAPLLDLCMSHPWETSDQKLEKEHLYNVLFAGEGIKERKLEKVMVEAHKVVRSFLLTQHYFRENNEFHQVFDFSEVLRKRNLEARYQHLLVRLHKMQEESLWKNEKHYHRQFLLEYAIFEDQCLHNQTRGDLNVPNTLRTLDKHYFLYHLTVLNHFLLQQKVVNITVPEDIKATMEETSIPKRYLELSSPLKVNYEIFVLLKKDRPEPSDVQFLFELLRLHETNLDEDSIRKFYTYLRNICVLTTNAFFDNEEIRLTLFDLYKDNLARGYLHYEGKLHPSTYLAVSFAAVRVKQSAWGLEFIEKYKHEIIGENEERDIYRFNMALYLFGVGKFSECLDFIPASSPFVDYLLQGKRLELKAYYEIRSDLLPYKLDAFKMFLSRTSQKLISETQKQLNVEFANFLTQISTSIPGDQKRADRMVLRLEEKKRAFEWRWLLEKAKALKEKL